MDHNIRNCHSVGRYGRHRDHPYLSSRLSGLGASAPKRNNFYALKIRGDQKSSLDLVTDKLIFLYR